MNVAPTGFAAQTADLVDLLLDGRSGSRPKATIPSPPASETAAASAGVVTRAMPASWIGSRHPTSSQKRLPVTPSLRGLRPHTPSPAGELALARLAGPRSLRSLTATTSAEPELHGEPARTREPVERVDVEADHAHGPGALHARRQVVEEHDRARARRRAPWPRRR